MDELVKRVIELDNDDDAYMDMLNAYPMTENYDPEEMQQLKLFLKNVFTKGNRPFDKDPRGFVKRMSFDGLGRKAKIKYLLFKQ